MPVQCTATALRLLLTLIHTVVVSAYHGSHPSPYQYYQPSPYRPVYGGGHLLGMLPNPYILSCEHAEGESGICTVINSCPDFKYSPPVPCYGTPSRFCCPRNPPRRPDTHKTEVETSTAENRPCMSRTGIPGQCLPLPVCHVLYDKARYDKEEVIHTYKCGGQRELYVCCPFGSEDPPNNTDQNGRPGKTNHRNVDLVNIGCGTMVEQFITNGETTGLSDFPWLALLISQFPNGTKIPMCGGSLITAKYVLTAAHCIFPYLKYVVLGEFDTSTKIDSVDGRYAEEAQEILIDDIVKHESYRSVGPQGKPINDIALIKLTHDAKMNNFVRPICLPLDNLEFDTFVGKDVEVAGWGRTSNKVNTAMSTTKQHVRLSIISNIDCSRLWNETKFDYTKICTLGPRGKDSCTGDSGGPIMRKENVEGLAQWHAIGIVSYGLFNCGSEFIEQYREVHPSINTRVTEYIPWILDNID